METRAHYAAVGAFVLAMVALAFAAVLWLARGQLNSELAQYYIYFEGPVTGLRRGAEVDYNGVPAGKVEDVRIDPQNVEQIRVTVGIDPKVPIKTDARASVESNLLSGVSYILIVKGTEDAPLLRPEQGADLPVIQAHRSRLANVTRRVPQLLEKLNDTADRLNDLLDEKNRQALGESLENLRMFTAGLAERNQELSKLLGSADAAAHSLSQLIENVDHSYSGPDGIGSRLSGAAGDFDKLARNLTDTNKQLQLAIGDVRPGLRNFTQQTLTDIGGLVAETRQLVSGLNRLAAGIERDPSRILFGDRRQGYKPQ